MSSSVISLLKIFSGARYVHDTKRLRMKMKKILQEDTYDHVFVHLGSNDVLCSFDVFYRNVTEVVDAIHEKTSCTIHLCVIPLRDLDRRRCTRTTPEKIKKYRRWIRTANDLLKEVSSHIPYVYYHPYSIDPVRHLSKDGLHLNAYGGRFCFRTIQDNVFGNYPVRADMSADVSLDIMQWPALHDNVSGIVSEIASVQRKTYASIVKEMPAVVTTVDECSPSDHMEQKCCPKIAKKRYRRVRYLRRSSRCAKKLGKMKNEKRSPVMGVKNLSSKVNHICEKKVSWISCPFCDVKCSKDDYLLDHVLRRHQPAKQPEKERATVTARVLKEDKVKCHTDIHCEHTTYADHSTTDLLTTEDHHNTSRMLLLLSNDVEQNPGPVSSYVY
ncbi:hypothetical protein ACF0H5_017305 [Mactra antiquata]